MKNREGEVKSSRGLARYALYIRLRIATHGVAGTRVYESDHYSRIVEKVASEHGHDSL